MTIPYSVNIASSSPCNVVRILKRWRGSVWKSVCYEIVIWSTCFSIIGLIYRHALSPYSQRIFEDISDYCRAGLSDLPLTFMLGFFVTIVVQRWTDTFRNMGYLENQAIHISALVSGTDDEARLVRRTLARYLCLAQVLVYRDISVKVQKRFPTYETIVKAGFLTENEKNRIEGYKLDYDVFWVPINWAFALVMKARREGKITADLFATKICDEIRTFRNNLQMLCNYDWIQVPLAYPQVVFLSVHTYFIICLVGRQFRAKDPENLSHIDLFFPYMTLLQYLFFVGWMKVAEGLLNPFGEDDDDFECNFLIDRNFQSSMCIVDQGHGDLPPLQKDHFWNLHDVDAIYSKETVGIPIHPLIGSAARAASERKDAQEEVNMVVRPKEETTPSPTPIVQRSKTEGRFRRLKRNSPDETRGAFTTRRVAPNTITLEPSYAMFRVEEGRHHSANNSADTDRVEPTTLETVTEEDVAVNKGALKRPRSFPNEQARRPDGVEGQVVGQWRGTYVEKAGQSKGTRENEGEHLKGTQGEQSGRPKEDTEQPNNERKPSGKKKLVGLSSLP